MLKHEKATEYIGEEHFFASSTMLHFPTSAYIYIHIYLTTTNKKKVKTEITHIVVFA